MPGFLDTLLQLWPPQPKFDPERDIPDLTGKVFIVTGANSGCGYYTTKALLAHRATVYLACRDESKALTAISMIQKETKNQGTAKFFRLDLASLESVQDFVKEFLSHEQRLDCLFNNAGVMWPPIAGTTTEGYDLQFGCNVLGHFYLTYLLLPILLSTAKLASDVGGWKGGRVVTTSSIGHTLVREKVIPYEAMSNTDLRKKIGTQEMYNISKLGNVLFANELHRRYADEGLISVSLNPGNIRTDLQRNANPIVWLILRAICYPTPYGALTQLFAGTTSDPTGIAGKYLVPWGRIGTPHALAQDKREGERLWDWMEGELRAKRFL